LVIYHLFDCNINKPSNHIYRPHRHQKATSETRLRPPDKDKLDNISGVLPRRFLQAAKWTINLIDLLISFDTMGS
jgi:hypothetical protein